MSGQLLATMPTARLVAQDNLKHGFFACEAKSAVAGLLGGEIDGNGGLPVSVSVWSVWRDV